MIEGLARVAVGLAGTLGLLVLWTVIFPAAVMTVVLYFMRFIPLAGNWRTRVVAFVCLAALGAGILAYWRTRTTCETERHAMKWESKRGSNGRLIYFDGRCWTTTPMPPRDMPF